MRWSFLIVVCASFSTWAHELTSGRSPGVGKGIVVEYVTADGAGKKSGMQSGDVLLSWDRGAHKGEIESPFDLPYIGFEEATRGVVRVHGVRGRYRKTWTLRSVPWGIATRPNFSGPLLRAYRDIESFTHANKGIEAVRASRTAAAMARNTGAQWLAPWILSHTAESLFRSEQVEASDDLYREAMQGATGASAIVKGDILRQWASLWEARDDLAIAEKYYQEELSEWQRVGGKMLAATTLNELGILSFNKGDLKNAESYLSQSLAISEKLAPGDRQRAFSLTNLALLYQYGGELGEAEKYYRRALAVEKRFLPGTAYLAETLNGLGELACWTGNLEAAEHYHKEALVLVKKLNLPVETANVLDSISDCRLEYGDLRGAEFYEKQVLSIRKRAGAGLPIAYSLASLGKIMRLEGKLDQAETYYQHALDITDRVTFVRPERAASLAGLADVAFDQGNLAEAEKNYRKALDQMVQFAPRSLDHTETIAALARTLAKAGNLGQAGELYDRALADLEYQTGSVMAVGENQARFRAKHLRYYREYMGVLIGQGESELAFQVLEASHARTLFEMLAHAQVDVRQGVDPILLARELELRRSLSAKSQYRVRLFSGEHTDEQVRILDTDISSLEEKYQQVKASIRSSSPAYAALSQPPTLRVKQIQQLLSTDTILLEYSLGVERSYVWVVTEDSLKAYELPSQAKIQKLARRVYNLLTARNYVTSGATEQKMEPLWRKAEIEYQQTAAQLSQIILGPLSSLLAGKRLVIVSDGALHYIPFSALPDPDDANGGKPLIVEHEIVNLPSASVLAELRMQAAKRADPPKTVAVLADPVFDARDRRVALNTVGVHLGHSELAADSSLRHLTRSAADVGGTRKREGGLYWERLMYSRKEAEAVLAVTPAGKGMKALDFQASRAMALNPALAQYRIVHLATHGLLDSKHPELSGLVFSLVDKQGKPQDGFLELQDIYNMNLPVELVVLSGCKTGLGEEIDGEGIIGLTRGFMYAGASRVVASLWGVGDWATAELMERFYRAMEQRHMHPAAALRAAQIEMWKQSSWKSPYYWAAFQIQGEWR